MSTPIEDKALRRILHKLRSDAHVAEAFAAREWQKQDPVASAYHEGQANGMMQAVLMLEKASGLNTKPIQPAPGHAAERP